MQQREFLHGRKFKNGSGDAGYGSEENYAFLEQEGLGNFFKYNTFHQEQHLPCKAEVLEKLRFKPSYLPYDLEKDEFICPAQTKMHPSQRQSPHAGRFEIQRYRQQARDNLLSEQGIALRQVRSTEPETVFGDIKHNMEFRRFMLRGLKKSGY